MSLPLRSRIAELRERVW